MSYRLKTIVEADTAAPSTVFTPTVINVGDVAVSDFNSNENTSNCCSTLFIDRSGVPPTPPVSQTPTLTPTPTITLTPTVTVTPKSIFPETGGARVVSLYGTSRYNNARALRMFYSDDFDNWTYGDPQYLNTEYSGTLARLDEYPYGGFMGLGGCIPRGAAYTNSTKTLFSFQSYHHPSYAIEVAKSDNTSGNPPLSYNGITFTKTIEQNNIYGYWPGSFDMKSQTKTGCFWDSNNHNGPCMHIVYANLNEQKGCNIFSYTFDPQDNTFTTPKTLECSLNNLYFKNFYTNNFYNNEQIVHKINNGKVYVAYGLQSPSHQPSHGEVLNPATIKILEYDRNNTRLGWNSFQVSVSPSQSIGSCSTWIPMNIRLAYWNDGSPVLGFIAQRQASGCNLYYPLADLYLTFKNNNSWQTSQLFATMLWYYGGGTGTGSLDRFTGYYTPFDMYVHPIEDLLHIIYVKEIQRTDSTATGVTLAGRKTVRLMKVNRQGSIVSDVLVFDTAIGPPAGSAPNGYYYSSGAHLKSFYKSTDSYNFTPYFYILTAPNGSGTPSYSNIFKYVNGAYTKIYEVAGFSPYGSKSGNVGAATLVFT